MSRRSEGLFAGSGISWRTAVITLVVIVFAFAAGIAAGWGTGQLPDIYRSANAPSSSPTPTPTPTPTVVVSLPPLSPIARELTDDDKAAGVITTDFTVRGDGTFTSISNEDSPPTDDVPVRLVRVDVEDGIDVDAAAFGHYVMSILNDPRGWGSGGRMQFIETQGVPDLRIVLASPYGAAALCTNPHAAGQDNSAAVESSSKKSSPEPTATPSIASATCADRGTEAISQYDWIAGLPGYGDDIVGARDYLITHATGHTLGEAESICVRGTALVMDTQREPMKDCDVNPWAFPDAPLPSVTPAASPSLAP